MSEEQFEKRLIAKLSRVQGRSSGPGSDIMLLVVIFLLIIYCQCGIIIKLSYESNC